MSDVALTMRGPVHGTKDARKVAIGSSVGAVIETYDFIGFGTAAALYFGHAFFPGCQPARRHPGLVRHPRVSGSPPARWAASLAGTWATSSAASRCWWPR